MMKGFTAWFTGHPCSRKSTLGQMLRDAVIQCGSKAEVLDGDEFRIRISKAELEPYSPKAAVAGVFAGCGERFYQHTRAFPTAGGGGGP